MLAQTGLKSQNFHSHLYFCTLCHTHTFTSFVLLYLLCLEAMHTLFCDTHSLSFSFHRCHIIYLSFPAPSLFHSLCFSVLSFHLLNYAPISLAPQGSSVPVRTLYKGISTRMLHTHTHIHTHTHSALSTLSYILTILLFMSTYCMIYTTYMNISALLPLHIFY